MIPITDEEAQDWPMDQVGLFCEECGAPTEWRCGHCGDLLCWVLSCIKSHAAKGCYNKPRHADDSRSHVNQDSTPDAGPQRDPSHAVAEPTVDGQAAQAASIPERS